MKPKLISVLLLFLLLIILISGCSSNKNSVNPNNSSSPNPNKISNTNVSNDNSNKSPITSPKEGYLAIDSYKKVMQNKLNFFSVDDKRNISLNDFLNEKFPGYPLKVTHFTVIDMDEDKIFEVVLELSRDIYPDYYEVLHYENGEVYGFNFGNRSFQSLKIDGTVWGSSGAADNICRKLIFKSNAYESVILGYSQSNQNKDGITISYFIDNKPVSQESFYSFIKEQDGKKDVVWYEFTQKNIETELSINS